MPSASHGTPSSSKTYPPARLNSWKEIADYLSKGERTAKRWENERSLPVHHVPGGGHGSVYAFTAELDKWLLSQNTKAEIAPQENSNQEIVDTSKKMLPARPAPREETEQLPTAPPSIRTVVLRWQVLPYAVLILVALFLAARFVSPHTHADASFLRSLLRATTPASTVSDPEKQLAHELYLRGRFEWNKRTADSLRRALDYFTQAVVHDPGNAQAYVGLADTYNLLREYTLMPEDEAYARGIAAAKKAVALDDTLADAHRSLAFDEVWGNWNFQAGAKEFERAIELNPRDPITHLWFANAFASPGWYPVCLREIDRAQELDPASHAILADKGLMLFHAGNLRDGLELVKEVELADPQFLSPHRYLAGMYLASRNYPNFLLESEKAAELSQDLILKDTTEAARKGFQRDGEKGLFNNLYASQKKFYAEGKLPATYLAITCARLGRKEEAIRLLQEDYDRHESKFLMIRDNPDLLRLRDERGYQKLLNMIRIPSPETVENLLPTV